ncbi:MAG: hypothetical protein GY765_16930 [bacterium]|nr:hypothetical protein [bacterium]
MKKAILLFLLAYCVLAVSAAIKIKPVRQFILQQKGDDFIRKPGSFIVTPENTIMVFDSKGSNIKVFNNDGQLKKIFGRKGLGPNEFVKPYFSAYREPFVAVSDYGLRRYLIYKRTAGDGFEFVRRPLLLEMPTDFQFLDDETILVCAYKTDKNQRGYKLFTYNTRTNKYHFILPSEVSFGFSSHSKYRKEYAERLANLGLTQFCDFSADSYYFVWTCDINIFKIDRKTEKIKYFGQKSKNFVTPYLNPEIKRAYDRRDHRLLYKLCLKMSYIRDIFVLKSGLVGILYVGPLKKNDGLNVMMQTYSPDGDFLGEFEVLNAKASHHYDIYFYVDKNTDHIYVMDGETSPDFEQYYKVHQYKILQ